MVEEKKLSNYFASALEFWEKEQRQYLEALPLTNIKGALSGFILSICFYSRYKNDAHWGSKETFLGKVKSRSIGYLLNVAKKDQLWSQIYPKITSFIEVQTDERKGLRTYTERVEDITPTPYLSLQDMSEGERGVFSNRADFLKLSKKIDEMVKTSEGIEAGKDDEGRTIIKSNWLTTQDYRSLSRIIEAYPLTEWNLNDFLDECEDLFHSFLLTDYDLLGGSWGTTGMPFPSSPIRTKPSRKSAETDEDYEEEPEAGVDKPFDPKLPYEENLKNRMAQLKRDWKTSTENDRKIIEKNINSCRKLIKAWQKPFKISPLAEFKKKMEPVVGFSKVKKDLEVFVDLYNDYGEKLPQQFLCLLGDPGVGKSYISGIIAEAMDWGYVNINVSKAELSELVGTDPTYRGSNYGKIVQAMIDYESRNLVIILDEFEKAKKTEVLEMISIITDVTKNWKDFDDNYFGFPVPLNNCLIILTGNKEIPIPSHIESRLKGNMIEISPLTYAERLKIVKIELNKVLDSFDIGSYASQFSDNLLSKCITETWGIRESKTNAQKLAMQLAVLVKKGNVPLNFDSHDWAFVEVKDDNFDKGLIGDWPE